MVRRRRQEGKLTSIYSMIHDYPGIFSMSDPGEAAWTIWYIESCGADGFLKWAYDAWCKDPLEEMSTAILKQGICSWSIRRKAGKRAGCAGFTEVQDAGRSHP